MTISEIAAKAGVSAATVSRVLNGKGHVKDSTRQQILHVIRQNEYVPSEIARGLSKSDSNNIGVFVTDIENPFFSKAVRGIAERQISMGIMSFCSIRMRTRRRSTAICRRSSACGSRA